MPRKIPSKNIIKTTPAADKNQGPAAKEQNNRIAEALTVLEQTIANKADAGRQEDRSEDRGNKRIAIATLIFVIFTTFGIFIQDFILHSSDEAAHISATAAFNAAVATKRAADAAAKQSEIAARQADSAEKAINQAQRAWVGPRNASSQSVPEIGKELTIIVEYQNTGREPSLETIFDSDIFTATNEEDNSGVLATKIIAFLGKCKTTWRPQNATVVFPSVGVNGSNYQLSKTARAELIDQDVIDGAKSIVMAGCFVYKTINTVHRSSYCYFFNSKKTKPANWNICTVGNDAD